MCTNLKCKFTHLAGTKRYKPRDQFDRDRHNPHGGENYYSNHERYPRQEESERNGNDQDRNHYQQQRRRSDTNGDQYNRNHMNPHAAPPKSPDMSFLSKLADQMNQIQEQIKEVREMYKPQTYPQYPWHQTQMQIPQYQAGQVGVQAAPQAVTHQMLQNQQQLQQAIPHTQ